MWKFLFMTSKQFETAIEFLLYMIFAFLLFDVVCMFVILFFLLFKSVGVLGTTLILIMFIVLFIKF